ncbi:hypothetical protein KIW84_041994 [Lathyrus oleraceus]|uniref:Secreted protein n=1 Tax=Pisum sativum TaxID=3888 RepID=A0A9D5ASG2_PEA|nr:hypothetical protein KIW84_041994 [Pisum sativum]
MPILWLWLFLLQSHLVFFSIHMQRQLYLFFAKRIVNCIAVGAGIAGRMTCAASLFDVVTKDSEKRKVSTGGAHIKMNVTPGLGV